MTSGICRCPSPMGLWLWGDTTGSVRCWHCCPIFLCFLQETGVVCSGNEAERMCLKPHAVVTVTERQVLPSAAPASPHTLNAPFQCMKLEGMQRWRNIWWRWWEKGRERVECVNKKVEDRRGEAEMTLAFSTLVWSPCVFACMIICVSVSLHPLDFALCEEVNCPSHSHTMSTCN